MEFDEIVVKESPGLCRCCLSEGCYKDMGTEYAWMNETEVYADMLLECFDISISQTNEGPNGPNRLICEVCITRLRDACYFKKQVLDSEKKFVDMVGRGDFRPKAVILYQSNMKTESGEDVEVSMGVDDAEVEYLEDDMDYEAEDTLKAEGRNQEPTVSADPLPIRGKRGRPKKPPAKPEKKKVKVETKAKSSKSLVKGAKISTVEDKNKKLDVAHKLLVKRRNIEYVLQYSNATPFLWYKSKYRCFYCTEPMKDPVALREHTAEHEADNLELIVHDRTKNNRNKDAAVKIDVTDIMCTLCPQAVANLEELIHHLIIAHDAQYDVSVPNCLLPFKLDKDQLTCPTCNMKFVFFEYLLRHANKYHLSHDYICDVCGTSFQGENHLKMHNRYYHRQGGYTCEYCGLSMTTLSKKILHERNVHSVNLSTCPHCPETFKSLYSKKLHLANVHGVEELKIKCPYCPKVYPQESIMSRHMRRVHLREKNVECEVCGEKFFGPYDVKLHMMKHNGEKKFVCSVCGKKFSKKSNLNSHSNIHSGDKRFVCTICNKSFAQQTYYKMHMRNTHVNVDQTNVEDVCQVEMVNFIGDLSSVDMPGQ